MSFDEYSSTQSVKAEQIEEARSVITPNGPRAATAGQWEVRYPDGNVQVVDDEQFTVAFKGGAGAEQTMKDAEADKVGVASVGPDPSTVGPESPETEEETTGEEEQKDEEAKSPTEPTQKTTRAPAKPR